MDNSFFKDIFYFIDIAVVGLSPNPSRPSNYVSKYMLENGYNIIPVNPGHKSIFDIECFSSLDRIPHSIDIVNVFRNSKYHKCSIRADFRKNLIERASKVDFSFRSF